MGVLPVGCEEDKRSPRYSPVAQGSQMEAGEGADGLGRNLATFCGRQEFIFELKDQMSTFPQIVSCDCGKVKYEALGEPIVTAVCYCDDCQDAGDRIDAIANVKPFRDEDGGTAYITLKDKDWKAVEGQNLLDAIKLKSNSPTERYVTTCCQSPLFIKNSVGFWTSTYRARYAEPTALEWRNKIEKRRSALPFPDDIPRFKGFPLRLFARLFRARFS